MRTRNKSALLMVATLTIALSAMPTNALAQSPAGTRAECSLSFPAHISPGLGMTPNSGAFHSAGETGSIDCVGRIHGHTVTGPGSFGFDGTLTDSSCLAHKGSGTSFFTVPTDAGPVHISGGGFTITGIGVFGNVEATHTDVRFIGSYILLPVKGNCVTAPVTEGRVLMTGSLRDVPDGEPSIKCDLDAAIVQVNCRTTS
jgi:hypothetical protein